MGKKAKQDSGSEKRMDAAAPVAENVTETRQDDLTERLKEKEKEAAENYDRYVRTLAELDNFRKRTAREKADLVKYGNENLLRDILPMIDNLDRALKHAETSCDFEAFKSGLEMLRTQFVASLERHGLEAMACVNETFDPNLHEAMLQVESDAHEDSQIVDEFEKGYLLHGRLLRPAKVSVCKKSKRQEDCV
jgi:molecular chaperone GrpE